MNQVCHEVIVPYTSGQMYDLVHDVASYQQFIPWCDQSTVEEVRGDNEIVATLRVKHKGIAISFTTLNRSVPDQQLLMELVSGPFEHLRGEWKFIKLGDEGCKVIFCLDYHFSNRIYTKLLASVFDKVVNSIMSAFLQRAKAIYG